MKSPDDISRTFKVAIAGGNTHLSNEPLPSGSYKKICLTCGKEFAEEVLLCPDDDELLTPVKADTLIGTVLAGKYEILEKLGAGGMGLVYKARHTLMKRMVAIKIMLPQLIASVSALKRFKQEAQAASNLNHPNILTVFDFGVTPDGMPYLVMDFLEGTNLSKILEAGTALPVGTAVDIFIQSCSALSHAHKKGIVHRDLKPANIMLVEYEGRQNFVKIVDFGMAKITGAVDGEGEDLTKSGEVFGSPLYMSPEQCMGKVLDARSDIYSLGCVIYRTLTGCTAVSGTSAIECFSHHVNSLPRPFAEACPGAEFPEGLEAIVMKSVAKDPDDRYQTMDELKDALLALAGIDFSSMYSSLGGANMNQHDTVLQSSYGSNSHYSQNSMTQANNSSSQLPVQNASDSTNSLSLTHNEASTGGQSALQNVASTSSSPQRQPVEAAPPQESGNYAPPTQAVPQKGMPVALIAIVALVLIGGGTALFMAGRSTDRGNGGNTTSTNADPIPDKQASFDDLIRGGRAAYDHADYAEALNKFELALAKAKENGRYERQYPEAQLCIGKACLELGQYDKAISAYQAVIKTRESSHNMNATDASEALNDLGNVYLAKDNFKEAKIYFDKALAIRKTYTGDDAVKASESLAGLGNLALAKGEFQKAQGILLQAMAIVDKSPSVDAIDKASVQNALGQSYQYLGKLTQAKALYEQALDLRQKNLSPDNPAIADSLLCLGTLEFRNRNYDRSEELLNRAKEIADRNASFNKEKLADIQFCLGVLYDQRKNKAKAIEMITDALNIRQQIFGAKDPATVETQKYLTQLKSHR